MFKQIRTRIVAYFVLTTVLVSLIFGLVGLVFSYLIEDQMFAQLLTNESRRIEQQLARGEQARPSLSYVRFYPKRDALPNDVLALLVEEPRRVEFEGQDGKHYHLSHIDQGYVLAEVSEQLVVRKFKGGLATTQLIIMLITIAVVAFVSWSLARRLIRPIDQLNTVLTHVKGAQLPLGFSSTFSNDEIGLFAKELDTTMARLHAFIQREQDFTRDVSHELRTPVAVSQGALSLLRDTSLDVQQKSLIARLQDAQNQMQRCIEGLLSLAREAGVQYTDVQLMPMIERAIVDHYSLLENNPVNRAGSSCIDLDITVPDDASITTDTEGFRIILANLVGNAFSHSDAGTIRIDYQPGKLIISNPSDDARSMGTQNMFESGIKGPASSGYGIGLSLVKRLCDRLELSISLNVSDGQTTATLSWQEQEAPL